MEDWQHSSLEEKVDLENLVLFPPESYPISRINEVKSGIKEEQSEKGNDSVDNDIKTEKVEVIEQDSVTRSFELCRNGAEICQICGLEFGNKAVLKVHNSIVHPEGNKDDQNIDLDISNQGNFKHEIVQSNPSEDSDDSPKKKKCKQRKMLEFKIKIEPIEEFNRSKMNVPANCEIKNKNIEVPCKNPKIKMDVKPKIETEFQVKNEPIDDINRGMEIINNMNAPSNCEIKDETIEVPYRIPKIEMYVKPKIKTKFQAKRESIEEFNRGMDIIGNMNAPANCEIKNEKIEVPYKKPKIEMYVKPKIETEFQAKSESIEEFNRGMEIIGNMNVPANFEIKNENIEVPYKKPKFQSQSESVDDINRGMMIIVIMNKIIEFMNIPIKAEIQNENIDVPYKIPKIKTDFKPKIEKDFKAKSESKSEEVGKYYCIICSKKDIPTKKHLKRHLNFAHEKDIAKKTRCDKCMVPFFGKPNLKISHMVDCYLCTKTKIDCKSNQKKPVVKAKIDSEKQDCFMCSQTKFYTNESLIQHMYSVHMGIIKEKKKCDLCMISFLGGIYIGKRKQRSPNIDEKISHLFNCYQKKGNKITNQREPVDIPVRAEKKRIIAKKKPFLGSFSWGR